MAQQRAQVIELLRCAADVVITGDPMTDAPVGIAGAGLRVAVRRLAWQARFQLVGPNEVVSNDDYHTALLEAAARVEEGSWLVAMSKTRRFLFIDGARVPAKFRLLLGMTWVGWLNFCVLQWIGLRLAYRYMPDGRIRVCGAFLAWPLTLWYWSWRREVIVPMLCSAPVVLLVVLAWRTL